jgi:hypothetical protein
LDTSTPLSILSSKLESWIEEEAMDRSPALETTVR